MRKNIDLVRKHFSDDTYIKEMFDRNNLGIKDWEKVVVEKYFTNNGNNLLDIGCGTGREAMALAKLGYKVLGIDISEKEIEIAKEEAKKEKLEIEYKLCNGINLEFDKDYFDYVIIWAQTLGNIYERKNRLKILAEAKRVLKNNGILCFSTHDYEFVKNTYKKFTKGNRFYPYINSKCNWKLFTIEELIGEISKIEMNILFCGKAKELEKDIDTNVLVCICKK